MTKLSDLVYEEQIGKTGYPLDHVRQLFHRSSAILEKDGSPFKSSMGENYFCNISGFDFSSFNVAIIYNSDPLILEEAIAPLYEANLPHSVGLGGAGLAHAEVLKAKGYVSKGAAPIMAYALDSTRDSFNLRIGLHVRRVETSSDLEIAISLLCETFDLPQDLCRNLVTPSLGVDEAFRYLLYDQDVPVCTILFARNGKLLGCFDVATPPAHQRKGYGEELMRWAFATHADEGDELVVLIASKAGQPLYRRLGFQFLEFLQSWHLEDTTRMRRFTHYELKFGDFDLRPMSNEDADWAIPAFNDESFVQWMGFPSPYEEKHFEAGLQRMSRFKDDGFGISWIIERGGVPQGVIACHHTDWTYKRTEIGYGAFAASRGTGVIPTVLRQLVEFLFREYGFERIEVRTDINNHSSRKAAEKAGFTFEGELRRNYLNLGEVTDDAIFSFVQADLNKGGSTQ